MNIMERVWQQWHEQNGTCDYYVLYLWTKCLVLTKEQNEYSVRLIIREKKKQITTNTPISKELHPRYIIKEKSNDIWHFFWFFGHFTPLALALVFYHLACWFVFVFCHVECLALGIPTWVFNFCWWMHVASSPSLLHSPLSQPYISIANLWYC